MRGLDLRGDILRRDRTHELEGDAAVAADHEGLRHPIDPPIDRGAAVAVGAGGDERVAVAADEAARVVGLVLVIDADDANALVLGELHEQRRFVVAGRAPGRPDIDQRDRAFEIAARNTRHLGAVAHEAGDRRQRGLGHRLSDQGRRESRGIAGEQPNEEQRRKREEGDERQQNQQSPPPAAAFACRHAHAGFFSVSRSERRVMPRASRSARLRFWAR